MQSIETKGLSLEWFVLQPIFCRMPGMWLIVTYTAWDQQEVEIRFYDDGLVAQIISIFAPDAWFFQQIVLLAIVPILTQNRMLERSWADGNTNRKEQQQLGLHVCYKLLWNDQIQPYKKQCIYYQGKCVQFVKVFWL